MSDSDTADGDGSDDGVTFTGDSPVAVETGDYGDTDVPLYGSRRDRLGTYEADTEEGTADDVDPRGLFDRPTVDVLRWHYRLGGIAKTVVEKPIRDAFKHGFTLDDAYAGTAEEWLADTYVPTYVDARIKARRDGFAFIFWNVTDTATVSDPLDEPQNLNSLVVLTLEDLANGLGHDRDNDGIPYERTPDEAAEATDFSTEQLDVTRHGIVVVDDITSADHEEYLGVLYETNPDIGGDDPYEFIHRDRLQHVVSRPHVDGDVHVETYGHLEGDSVLAPIYHSLSSIKKAEWSLGQSLLRYTAPLFTVEIDETVTPQDGDWETHMDKLREDMDGITNKSNAVLPPGHTMDAHSADSDLDPEPFLMGLVNMVCAGSEMTKSVLFGTQTGTVSGQSTDIKNYYNQVERDRENVYAPDLLDALKKMGRIDPSTVPSFDQGASIDWNALFRIDDLDRTEAMSRIIQSVSQATSNYLLTMEEARDIIEMEWAEIDVDVDFDDITESDYDELDRVNVARQESRAKGQPSEEQEYAGETEGNPEVGQNGGGREAGETSDPDNPSTDDDGETSPDGLTDDGNGDDGNGDDDAQ